MFTKSLKIILTPILATVCMTSCVVEKQTTVVKESSSPSKPLPPGQAKKVTGSQSAKSYAPGQQKKKPK